MVRPSSSGPASDSQVVLISSAVPALLGHFVRQNSRALLEPSAFACCVRHGWPYSLGLFRAWHGDGWTWALLVGNTIAFGSEGRAFIFPMVPMQTISTGPRMIFRERVVSRRWVYATAPLPRPRNSLINVTGHI